MNPDRERWNEKWRKGHPSIANAQLIMHQGRLTRGRALDVAAGTGENAAILALAGWNVVACDLSDESVKRIATRRRELKADLEVVQADAGRLPFDGATFDLIACTYFYDRKVVTALPDLLKPGGTIFFQGFTPAHLRYVPDFKYCVENVKSHFLGMQEVLYKEEDDGHQAYAVFIGKR